MRCRFQGGKKHRYIGKATWETLSCLLFFHKKTAKRKLDNFLITGIRIID